MVLKITKKKIGTYVYSKNFGFLSPAGSNVSKASRVFAHFAGIYEPGVLDSLTKVLWRLRYLVAGIGILLNSVLVSALLGKNILFFYVFKSFK